eukprot:1692658-Amphidinium_carterae.1
MPWWDWLYMRFELPDANEVSAEKIKLMEDDAKIQRRMMEGKIPLYVPILGVPIYTGEEWEAHTLIKRSSQGTSNKRTVQTKTITLRIHIGMTLDWKPEAELFAGDQIRNE